MPSGYFGLSTFDSEFDDPSGSLDCMRFQNSVGNGTLTKLEVLLNEPTPAGTIYMGVYDDNANAPNNRLLDAGSMAAVDGWNVISGLSLAVTSGTWYWLAYNRNTYEMTKYLTGQPANSHWRKASVGGIPDPYPAPPDSMNTNQYTMRAWVELAAGVGAYVGSMGGRLIGHKMI